MGRRISKLMSDVRCLMSGLEVCHPERSRRMKMRTQPSKGTCAVGSHSEFSSESV